MKISHNYGDKIWEYDKACIVSLCKFCNNSCPYCIAQYSLDDKTQLDLITVLPLLAELGQNGWTMEITGGEPTLAKGFLRFINLLSEQANILLLTNGTTLRQIIPQIPAKVKILSTWHSLQRKIEEYPFELERENLEHQYIVHPHIIATGKIIKDMREFERFAIKPVLGFFEGIYKDKLYSCNSDIYDEYDATFAYHLTIPRKNLNIEQTGYIYKNYEMSEIIGNVYDFGLEKAETIPSLSYYETRKMRKEQHYKPVMRMDL